MRWLFPKFGWVPCTMEDKLNLDIPVREQWEMWRFEWLGFGFTTVARSV
jgi:hypothetical protein